MSKTVYISTDFYKDERFKSIDKNKRASIMVFWFDLINLASKYGEKENLKNCLNRKKLPKVITDRSPEFIDSALETLESLDLLNIKSINDIVRFEE